MASKSKSKTRKGRKQRTHKVRRQRGAGWGFTGAGSIPGTPGTVSNPQVFTGIGDCRAVRPGYDIPTSQYGASLKGLPGMNGGGWGKRSRKAMKGGRYGFAPDMIPGVTPQGGAWWAATYGPVQRIACEGSTPNPLNLGPHTPSTQPLPVASSSIPLKGLMSGGAQQMAPASVGPSQPTGYGVGNVDSMYYYAPTGGYANTASTWKDSVGAPVQIQVPYAARAMNQACLTTGGPPPLTGALQKGGKRSRKNRKQKGGLRLANLPFVGRFFGTPKPSLEQQVGNVYPNVNTLGLNKNKKNNNTPVSSLPPAPSGPLVRETGVVEEEEKENVSGLPLTPVASGNKGTTTIMGGKHRGRKHRKGKKSRKGLKGSRKH